MLTTTIVFAIYMIPWHDPTYVMEIILQDDKNLVTNLISAIAADGWWCKEPLYSLNFPRILRPQYENGWNIEVWPKCKILG